MGVATDSACSSSLVALHLACRHLLHGDVARAIVGAADLMLAPEETIALARRGILAADGRCKAFDGHADGFVRGEGCVVVVLEGSPTRERPGGPPVPCCSAPR